jgi:hypothetical protein
MPKKGNRKRSLGPLAIVMTVAAFGLLSLLVVNHGPWNRPRVQSPEIVHHTDTAAAAQAASATVTPTAPKSEIEPVPAGPEPAQPANPAPREN